MLQIWRALTVGWQSFIAIGAIFRYVCIMKIFRIFILLCITAMGQGATFSSVQAANHANSQEQRRVELRAALKARNNLDSIAPVNELVPAKPPLKRQLSDLERADLRQQLRQQLRSGKSNNP